MDVLNQVLIIAVTGQVGPGTQVTGNATYQELGSARGIAFPSPCIFFDWGGLLRSQSGAGQLLAVNESERLLFEKC